MRIKHPLLLSCLIALLIMAPSYLPLPYVDLIFWPEEAISSIAWPQGIHSDFRHAYSLHAMLATYWIGTFLTWTAVAYAIIQVGRKARRLS